MEIKNVNSLTSFVANCMPHKTGLIYNNVFYQ